MHVQPGPALSCFAHDLYTKVEFFRGSIYHFRPVRLVAPCLLLSIPTDEGLAFIFFIELPQPRGRSHFHLSARRDTYLATYIENRLHRQSLHTNPSVDLLLFGQIDSTS